MFWAVHRVIAESPITSKIIILIPNSWEECGPRGGIAADGVTAVLP